MLLPLTLLWSVESELPLPPPGPTFQEARTCMAAGKRWKGKEVACAAVTGSVSEASVAALGCVNVETLAGRRNCLRCCCFCCWAANVRLMLLSVATDTDARFLWN